MYVLNKHSANIYPCLLNARPCGEVIGYTKINLVAMYIIDFSKSSSTLQVGFPKILYDMAKKSSLGSSNFFL